MAGIVPSDVQEFGASVGSQRRPPRLSRRRVKAIVRIGQLWTDLEDGTAWTLAAIYAKDGQVRLERQRTGWSLDARFESFTDLGRRYRPPTMVRGP